ncbi:ABC transporter permease [Bifidobacterium samirii]|uniref:ABC transporter permease n=2 Tax=Bifidobacterium samirii TaxID=2306974 RepID=A0A430FWC1_9BIFI|nr:ABC transporter permease [Bifidobacterium samirii]
MTGAFVRDMLRCWVRGWKRFVSIAVIVMLGVAVLTGIYAGCRDMFRAADRFYAAQGLHDIEVLSTYGLTDDDVDALRGVDGVAVVQAERSQSVETTIDGTVKSVTMREIGDAGLDRPYLSDGRMPSAAGEIAVTLGFLLDSGLTIGDTLSVEPAADAASSVGLVGAAVDAADPSDSSDPSDPSDSSDSSDSADSSDDDAADSSDDSAGSADAADADAAAASSGEQSPSFPTELTIVGEVIDPKDLSNPDGIGTEAFRQNVASDYTFFTSSAGVTGDVYTSITVAVDGTDGEDAFSDAYDDIVAAVADRIEATVQTDRQRARRDRLVADAQDALDEARVDAERQFADAQRTIDDNRAEVEKNAAMVADQRKAIDDNAAQIADGEQQLADARAQLADARRQLADGRSQIASARTELEDGKRQLASARTQLDRAQNELTANRTQVEQGLAQVDQSLTMIDQVLGMLDGLTPGIDDATWQRIRTLLAALGIDVPATAPDPGTIRTQLETQRAQLQATRDQLQTTLDGTIIPAQTQLDAQNAQLSAKEQEAAAGAAELDRQSAALEANAATLETQATQLETQAAQLAAGKTQLDDGERQLKAAETQLDDARTQLDDAQTELDQRRSDALDEIARQQQRIDDVADATWYVQTRSSISGFSAFDSDISSIESIGRAFPVVFLLVAVLMSLTAMTRMVEEERGLIGTYVGLGYGRAAIAARYVLFAALACLIGGGLGLIAGFVGIPAFLRIVLEGLYMVPDIRFEYDWAYGTGGVLLFVAGVVGATVVACMGELRQTPAALMRPKAPKAGARVLLERIGPLWRRLSFLNKVTVRNIARFKSRLIMTVGGVAGCTALIVCGFAINDSVDTIGAKQYDEITRYDLLVVAGDGSGDAMRERVADDGRVDATLDLRIDSGEMTVDGAGETVQLLIVPDGSEDALNDMIDLRDAAGRSGRSGWLGRLGRSGGGDVLTLGDDGAIVAQSAANALGVEAGDTIRLRDSAMRTADVTVAAVSRNLIGSDVYLSETLYRDAFDVTAPLDENAMLATMGDADDADDEAAADARIAYAQELSHDPAVLTVSSTDRLQRGFQFELMSAVVALIVGLAGSLALVVLFTLSNTNVSERVREMATLKVLGFYDREVHTYVNKEMLILTGMGVAVGLPLGRWIGGLLTAALNMPGIYFEVDVRWTSYLIAAGATVAFALLVHLFTNPVLDRIDPVSSLKSVE